MVIADTPTLGLLIGLPAAVIATVACAFVAWRTWRADDRYGDLALVKWGAVICGALVVFGAAICFWPYKHDYHFYVDKGGKVDRVAKRIINDGDGNISERFVLTIDGQPYGVDDTRAANVRPGDTVDIACKREYQWGSKSHGWACRWNGEEDAAR